MVPTSDQLGPKSDNEKSCYTDATITDTKDSVSDLMLPCNSSDSSDWLKICLYKYGTCPSIKSCMKQYLIFICDYHSMKCRNKQSCQFRQKDYSQFRNKQLITDFHFTESCSKDIFDFLIDAWWYLWTNCPEVKSKLMKFHTPHQEFTIQNLYALLWCKLHRSTSSQLGTKLIFRKYLSCLMANLSTSIKPRLSTSTQIMSKWFSFFCFLHF